MGKYKILQDFGRFERKRNRHLWGQSCNKGTLSGRALSRNVTSSCFHFLCQVFEQFLFPCENLNTPLLAHPPPSAHLPFGTSASPQFRHMSKGCANSELMQMGQILHVGASSSSYLCFSAHLLPQARVANCTSQKAGGALAHIGNSWPSTGPSPWDKGQLFGPRLLRNWVCREIPPPLRGRMECQGAS